MNGADIGAKLAKKRVSDSEAVSEFVKKMEGTELSAVQEVGVCGFNTLYYVSVSALFSQKPQFGFGFDFVETEQRFGFDKTETGIK
jgi:hypothetical protein